MALLLYAVFLKQARQLFDTPDIRRNRVIAAGLVACATLLCMAGNMVSDGALGCRALRGACHNERRGIGHAACELRRFLQRMRPAHDCPVRGAFHGGERAGVRLDAYRERGRARPVGASVCLVLPFLELLCLNKCSADLVDKLEFSFLTMPVRTASFAARFGVPSVIFGVLLGILRCCALTGPLLDFFLSAGS